MSTTRVATANAAIPIETKIGQLIMAGVHGAESTDDARYLINELRIGNFILMGRNIQRPAQVLALTQGLQQLAISELGIPALIGTDQEGGFVQRLESTTGFLPMPDAATVGASRHPDAIRAYARAVGEELQAVGVNVDFAPVLDVNTNPDNPVIGRKGRSFGPTPEQVIETAIPFMLGLRDADVMAGCKHFPGHGGTTQDSHVSLPAIASDRASLDATELPPFRAAIAEGIEFVMPAHVAYEALDPSGMPASVSEPILTGLLRQELGYDGVIISDDLTMNGILERFPAGEAAVRVIEAGADLVLCVRMLPLWEGGTPVTVEEIHTALHDAVTSGRLPEARIDQSFNRIMRLKNSRALGPASGQGLDRIRGAEHFHALARVLDEVANRREEAAQP
jgi:beta-N-acetylhexosaminidase